MGYDIPHNVLCCLELVLQLCTYGRNGQILVCRCCSSFRQICPWRLSVGWPGRKRFGKIADFYPELVSYVHYCSQQVTSHLNHKHWSQFSLMWFSAIGPYGSVWPLLLEHILIKFSISLTENQMFCFCHVSLSIFLCFIHLSLSLFLCVLGDF